MPKVYKTSAAVVNNHVTTEGFLSARENSLLQNKLLFGRVRTIVPSYYRIGR